MTAPSIPPRPGERGFFLSLDGPDGGGKTTQVGHLVRWFQRHGIDAVACRDPGGTELGEKLRAIVMGRQETSIAMRAEMLLYMASRAQLVEEVIRPALASGRVVVCDRFLLANVAYQGYAGGLPVDDLWRVGLVATGGLLPDLTVLIDVPPEVALARMGGPRDRIEDRPEAYRAKVRAGFLHAAANYPAPIVTIDGSAEADAVLARIVHEVARSWKDEG